MIRARCDRGSAGAAFLAIPALCVTVLLVLVCGLSGADALSPGCEAPSGGADLSDEQETNAGVIVRVVQGRGLPAYAGVVAVATAYQESRLRNLPYGDAAGPDSAGLFQQRPSAGWGTRAQVLDPFHSTNAFLDRLISVPRWQTIPLTVAAQAVQNSAHPGAYARWEQLARAVVAGGPACETSSSGRGVTAGSDELPRGFVVTGSPKAQRAVRFALAQLGKPYRWGGSGPDSFDCSGLTMAAWATAGVSLPHFTGAQVRAGTSVGADLSQSRGGDLVFIPGSRGTPANPRHMGMVAGVVPAAGESVAHVYIVQAPQTGMTITLTDARDWASKVVTVRRIA